MIPEETKRQLSELQEYLNEKTQESEFYTELEKKLLYIPKQGEGEIFSENEFRIRVVEQKTKEMQQVLDRLQKRCRVRLRTAEDVLKLVEKAEGHLKKYKIPKYAWEDCEFTYGDFIRRYSFGTPEGTEITVKYFSSSWYFIEAHRKKIKVGRRNSKFSPSPIAMLKLFQKMESEFIYTFFGSLTVTSQKTIAGNMFIEDEITEFLESLSLKELAQVESLIPQIRENMENSVGK